MAQVNEIDLRIEAIAAGGEGFGRLNGKSIFVGATAPDEKVRCRITEEHKNWARAELLEVVEASANRVEPACSLYGICGGCDLQHISYEAQLDVKAAILRETFHRIGGLNPPSPEIVPSQPWEYRNRMQLHFTEQLHHLPQSRFTGKEGTPEQKCSFGLKAKKSGSIIPVSDCPVADPGIRVFLQNQEKNPLFPAPESVSRTTMRVSPPKKERFTVFSHNGLFLCEGRLQRGNTTILNKEINLDASVFFQSNVTLLESLITKLTEIAASADHSLAMADLYCGVGTFACFLGELFPAIDLLEENKSALALAKENFTSCCKETPAEFFALRDTDWPQLSRRGHGFIVVDPPRTGLASALASWLAKEGPPILAYVSCSAASLARDSKILRKGSYELTELYLYDFYPQTAHIESLAVFRR